MKAKLFCKAGKLAGASFEIRDEAVIGRGSGNEVVLRHESISGRHARLSFDTDRARWVIEDLESLNGTEVDGLPISAPEVLDHLHVVTFAEDHDFIFHAAKIADARGAKTSKREVTEVELDVPVIPELKGSPKPQTRSESTDVDRELVILPHDLVERAASAAEDPGDEDQHGTEKTRLEVDFPLPARVLQEADGALDSEASPGSTEDLNEEQASAEAEDSPGSRDLDSGEVADPPVAEIPIYAAETVDFDEEVVETLQEVETPEFVSESPFSALAAQDRWFLEVEEVDGRRRRFEICEGENLLGRGAEMQIQLETPELSRRHAAFLLTDTQLVIRDEGSQNGTFVDGERLTGEREIYPGVRLRFATVAATVTVQAHRTEDET